MESTNVYWIRIFEILEQRGFEVMAVNARDAKHVPGRKTNVNDPQWLQRLHEYGLLRASFRPQAEIAGLRGYLRQRERLLDYTAAHIQHMQKALMQMNLQLHHVVSDITGATGMSIIRAIAEGERDPAILASHRERGCHPTVETVCQALVGNYWEELIFALTQAPELHDVYQTKVTAGDMQIQAILTRLKQSAPPPTDKLLPVRRRTRHPNAPAFDARPALHAIPGVDLTRLDGPGPYHALKPVAEYGSNLTAWSTAKHFTLWLALAPHNKISGGMVLPSNTRRTSNRAASLLRLAAGTVGRTDTALGAFSRCLSARVGKAKAIAATAHKIAVLFYNTLRHGMTCNDSGATDYEDRYRQRVLATLQRRAKSFGFVLHQADTVAGQVVVS